ncbi:MAG: capsule biosynthesis protein [Chloroflexi bacterium]|nr:MAG: capsule biosynthesis protein [Chloroflexota bacterium]
MRLPFFGRNALDGARPQPKFIKTQVSDWGPIIQRDAHRWKQALRAAKAGPHILIGTGAGGSLPSTPVDTLLAVALTLRGARVDFLLCDRQLPACTESYFGQFSDPLEFAKHGPLHVNCDRCLGHGLASYEPLGLPIHLYSSFIANKDRERAAEQSAALSLAEIKDFIFDDIPVGQQAYANALRFFVKGDLSDEPLGEAIARRYLRAAILSAIVTQRLLQKGKFEATIVFDGIYVPFGVVGDTAVQNKVRAVRWGPGYRTQTLIFSHQESRHLALIHEPPTYWENMLWDSDKEQLLFDYLDNRWSSRQNWIGLRVENQIENDIPEIERQMGIDLTRPTVGLLTNLMWDGQIHYPSNAFSNILDWVIKTIDYFERRPELQLVIRVHPMEARDTLPTRQPILGEIAKVRPQLPKNVFVIPPASPINTYAVMTRCNAVLIYGTRTGLELASMGVPVIVAGEAMVRDKGITLDAHNAAEYFEFLDQLPFASRLEGNALARARKYAFYYYFLRMIPVRGLTALQGFPPYKIAVNSLEDLLPGQDEGLDLICQGILEGSEFIYPMVTANSARANQLPR